MKPSVLLSSLSWASLFSLIWMILLKYIKPEPSAIGAMIFFFIISIISSAIASTEPAKQ